MPFLRRIGRGGLLQAAARTAVVAGTATAVSGGIRRFQERDRYDEAAAAQPAPQAGGQPGVGGSAGAGGGGGGDMMQQLERLAALHQQGALTAEEFAAAKGKLLGL